MNSSKATTLGMISILVAFFFFNDTATTEIYTLSLHDALPICPRRRWCDRDPAHADDPQRCRPDRKSTRLNSSHGYISYAVFCLKKKTHRCGRAALGARGARHPPGPGGRGGPARGRPVGP